MCSLSADATSDELGSGKDDPSPGRLGLRDTTHGTESRCTVTVTLTRTGWHSMLFEVSFQSLAVQLKLTIEKTI